MSSTKEFIIQTPESGIDQSGQSFTRPKGSFWYLLNFRPWLNKLTQTPLFRNYFFLSIGAHGLIEVMIPIVTDQSTAPYYLVIDRLRTTIVTAPGLVQTLVNYIIQTQVPNNNTINGQLLAYPLSVTTFNTNTSLDVSITDSTHFQWRVNGGAYSASTLIALNTVINTPDGNINLKFQAVSGFTTGDKWTWIKSEIGPMFFTVYSAPQIRNIGSDYYIAGLSRYVLRYRAAYGTMTTVGYNRIYGDYVAIFYNHLVIGRYASSIYSGSSIIEDNNKTTTPYRLAWSDLNDPDNFFATDINEADGKDIQGSSNNDDSGAYGITGLETLRSQCFVFTADNIFSMTYVGLPNVMQIDPMNFGVGSIFVNGVVKTINGIVFIAHDNIYLFDGNSVTAIGNKIRDVFFASLPPKGDGHRQYLRGWFDRDKNEVNWTYKTYIGSNSTADWQGIQLVYQVVTGHFYFRNMPDFDSTGDGTILSQCPVIGQFQKTMYGRSNIYIDSTFQEAGFNAFNLQKDYTPSGSFGVSTGYSNPVAETQDYVGDVLAYNKEIESLYIDGEKEQGDGLQISYANRQYVNDPTYTVLSALWANTLKEGRSSLPRVNFRALRLRFKGWSISASVVSGFVIRAWGMFIYGNKQETEK